MHNATSCTLKKDAEHLSCKTPWLCKSHLGTLVSRTLANGVTFANVPSTAGAPVHRWAETSQPPCCPTSVRFCPPHRGSQEGRVHFSVLQGAPAPVPLTGAEPRHLVEEGAVSLPLRRRPPSRTPFACLLFFLLTGSVPQLLSSSGG